MPLPAGTCLGPYEIVATIGAGGMGEVYRARDTRLDRIVAVKVSKEQFGERFEREARAVAALNHPNICTLHDVGPNYLVMEYVEGPTLADRLHAALPLAEALPVARQIAGALEAAHDKGIVHRDLKPANIKLTADGTVKVLDFGLAKAFDRAEGGSTPADSPTLTISATRAGVILGTAAYMSPEQARGTAVDKRADIWSYGVVLFEMLTGSPMFAGETISDTLAGVLRAELDWAKLPADTPPNIRRLLRRCLERDRKQRLRDIGDARLELDEVEAAAPGIAPAAPAKVAWLPWGIAALLLAAAIWLAVAPVRTPPAEPSVQSSILPPEQAELRPPTGAAGGIALSPDGGTLAFVAAQEGKTLIWIRRLDSLTARPLLGTDNGYDPFWSPDSGTIAFFADPKLKKVDVSGGPVQVICDAIGGRGGTWNSEGTIVFALLRGLFRVPEAGGQAVPIVRHENELLTWPWFLPDGRHFLFWSTRANFGDSEIVASSLDRPSDKPQPLVRASSNAMYVPGRGRTGWLLTAQRSTVFAQRFDVARLKVEGDAVPVAEHVATVPGLGLAGFSVSQTGALVFSRDTGVNSRLHFLDRAGKSLPETAAPGVYLQPRLSPDGSRLAFSQVDGEGNSDIWLMDLAREPVSTRFTFEPLPDIFPLWSPDGKQVAFTSTREGHARIYVKAASGVGNEQPITEPFAAAATYDWSHDGRYILYLGLGATTGPDLFIYDLKERKSLPLVATPFNESQGQFSPDGHWIAYSSDESSHFEVYVRSFAGNSKFQISANGGGQARWRGDGKELYYVVEGKMMAVPIKENADTFERGTSRVLFESRALVGAIGSGPQGYAYDVTRDGQRFLVIDHAEQGGGLPLTLITNWPARVKK